ncbi:MAG: methionine synthase [Vulcanimicrobiaceae bacterium]
MKIRGEEVLLPMSAVSAFPRPHWLQGRILGSLHEPVYRSHNLRVTYEDASKLCARDQEEAGLDILCDGAQYYEWEAPGFQLEPIFHFIPENLGGFTPYGPPGDGQKYEPFYKAIVTGKIEWIRPIFEPVVYAMKHATKKPFKVAFLGPAQQSVIVDDRFYKDPVKLATDLAIAMNKELKYLVGMGLESVQLIDVLLPYTTDPWQIDVQDIMFDGVDAIKFWHVCYGSVDGQRDIFDDHASSMLPLFARSKADVIHLETCNKGFVELDVLKNFPTDKVLGIGVVDAKNTQVESVEQIAEHIRRGLEIAPAERLLISPDCGLGYFSRTVAYAKLRNMGEAVRRVRAELGASTPDRTLARV